MSKFSKYPADVVCELHPLFKGLQWVASARSTDETRAVLNAIHVEREGLLCHIVATDGRRMHIHTFEPGLFDDDIDMIEPGLYDLVIKSTKLIVIAPSECGSTYPNWRGIIPDYEPEHSDCMDSRSFGKIGVKTGVLLAADFVVDAVGFGHGRKKDEMAVVHYGSPEKTGPFVISHDIGKAIVMPLKFEDEEEAPSEEPKSDAEATPDFPELGGAFESLVKTLAADGEGSMTISGGGKSVTITSDQAKAAVKRAKKAAKKAAKPTKK